jgi:hypothetical protein
MLNLWGILDVTAANVTPWHTAVATAQCLDSSWQGRSHPNSSDKSGILLALWPIVVTSRRRGCQMKELTVMCLTYQRTLSGKLPTMDLLTALRQQLLDSFSYLATH